VAIDIDPVVIVAGFAASIFIRTQPAIQAALANEEQFIHEKSLSNWCTGQDGSYLCEFLLRAAMRFMALNAVAQVLTRQNDHILQDFHEVNNRFFLHYADLADGSSLAALVYYVNPDEIYNLGAQSQVKVASKSPNIPPML